MLQANDITSDRVSLLPTHQANTFTTDSHITNSRLLNFLQILQNKVTD